MDIDLENASAGEAAWLAPLRRALAEAPDPARARKLAASVLAEVPSTELGRMGETRSEQLSRVLVGCCGVAPFLAFHLRRHPSWTVELVDDDLARPRDRAVLEKRLAQELAAEPGAPDGAIRRFKYFELARLTVRDSTPEWVDLAQSAITFRELSLVADVALEAALTAALDQVAASVGPPVWRDATGSEVRLGFAVLGLGKLGAEELNFSSDVDLVYVMQTPPAPLFGGPADQSPESYFSQVADVFGKLVNTRSEEGFLYRIDLELRPGGSGGPLLVSDEVLSGYYETAAALWEKAAFMKARPVAGDMAVGWDAIRAVSPMIYSSSMDYGAVRDIKALKERIESERAGDAARFDVKLDSGGIRDVEYVAQALQLLHGGRIPQVRERGSVRSLEALADVGLIAPEDSALLIESYLFLRRLENRLQMVEERQTQRLPEAGSRRSGLACAMGFAGDAALDEFEAALGMHQSRVREQVGRLFVDAGRDRIVDLLARAAPTLLSSQASQAMLESLAEDFGAAIDSSSDPERALNNLDRFVRGIGSRRFYFELLIDRPELVFRLSALFASSRFLSDILARHPRLIEPLFANPDRLLLAPSELRADLEEIRSEQTGPEDLESVLATLRLFHHRQILNVGLLDAADRISRRDVETALVDIAEACIQEALRFAREARSMPDGSRFLVVGMGKLGSREMSYGSDLDLIFLYDIAEGTDVAEAQARFVRLAQQLISLLQTPTTEGRCYEIDARMRPSGNQGSLVTSLSSFEQYHATHALPWERQALLRARGVAGDAVLREAFEGLRGELLRRPLPDDLTGEIHRIRLRMENELAKETGKRRDFKTGRGGVLDIESVVQYLRLLHGREHPALLEPTPMDDGLQLLGQYGLLAEASLQDLKAGWEFLQRLGSRLRIVENRSISDLDEERGDLDGLARRLGYPAGSHQAGPRRALLRDYRSHADRIRAVYDSVFSEAGHGSA